MSVTLSTSVVIVSDSTGSRPIVSNSLMTEPFARGQRPRTTEDKHPGGKQRGAGYVGRPPEATDHRLPHRTAHSLCPLASQAVDDVAARPGALVGVFFRQRYAAARRRLRHPQRRMPPAMGVGRLPAR